MASATWIKLRQGRVWKDPLRTHRTLLSFSETEEDGGKDLVHAARRVGDPELRKHLERHAQDELRHARLFRERAAGVAEEHRLPGGAAGSGRAYDLAGARPGLELDAHGFFNAGLIDALGELEYVAMLHVAEGRAAQLFSVYRELNAGEPRTRALFDEILKDEKYHVAYTQTFLEKWRRQGRGGEVERALKKARGDRRLGAWKRLGLRSASGFSHTVLFVSYWTLLAPFGLLSRSRALPAGWQAPRDAARSGQY